MIPSFNEVILSIFRIFDKEEVDEIRAEKLSDIIKQVTAIADNDIQDEVFQWKQGDPCEQPVQLNQTNLEHCPYLTGYDYFQVRHAFSYVSFEI